MRLWLTPSTDISLRDQIVRQISLAMLSGELAPGERLPSVRALARRFKLHANTVSAAYRQLHEQGLVTSRRGSGVYVQANLPLAGGDDVPDENAELAGLLTRVVALAETLDVSRAELVERLEVAARKPRGVVLVESDEELARIVRFEIESAGRQAPEHCTLAVAEFTAELRDRLDDRMAAVMPSKAAAARAVLGGGTPFLVLQINTFGPAISAHLPRSREHLVAIASGWPRFVETARSMLISVGFAGEAIVLRDVRCADWEAGLTAVAAVICDSLTATRLPAGARAIVFPLLARGALEHFARRV